MIGNYNFETHRTSNIKMLVLVRWLVACLSHMQKSHMQEGLCSSPGHESLEEPPDLMDFLREILIEAKWFLAEPIMLFSASTFMSKILSTQV